MQIHTKDTIPFPGSTSQGQAISEITVQDSSAFMLIKNQEIISLCLLYFTTFSKLLVLLQFVFVSYSA